MSQKRKAPSQYENQSKDFDVRVTTSQDNKDNHRHVLSQLFADIASKFQFQLECTIVGEEKRENWHF